MADFESKSPKRRCLRLFVYVAWMGILTGFALAGLTFAILKMAGG